MIRKFISSMILAALVSTAAQAAENPGGIALEVKAEGITMSADDGASIIVKSCRTCSDAEYEVTVNTSYEIGDVQVRRDDLRRELMRRPEQLLLVQLTPDRKHVARIKISAYAH